jgi:hypothetical protein
MSISERQQQKDDESKEPEAPPMPPARTAQLKGKPPHPIQRAKTVMLNFKKANGTQTRQSMAVTPLETAADVLRFVTLPTDGTQIVLKRDGTGFRMDEPIYEDIVLPNEDLHIVAHPETRK